MHFHAFPCISIVQFQMLRLNKQDRSLLCIRAAPRAPRAARVDGLMPGFGARGSEVVIHSLRILMFGNSWIDGRATETYRNIQKHTETYRDSDIVMNLGWVNSNR